MTNEELRRLNIAMVSVTLNLISILRFNIHKICTIQFNRQWLIHQKYCFWMSRQVKSKTFIYLYQFSLQVLFSSRLVGMDAFGRREIWNILKILKHHHTVILTSTYMDEAEYLADKIALLAHGRLICYGSVEFLKKQYDTGYFLKCSPFRDVKLDAQAILALVRNRVGENAEEQKNSTIKDVDNLIIELPIVDFLKFSELCEDFDRNQIKMGIKKYTFKQIGLNDIFIKICESISIDKDGPDLYVRRDSAGDVRSAMTCTHCTVSYPL